MFEYGELLLWVFIFNIIILPSNFATLFTIIFVKIIILSIIEDVLLIGKHFILQLLAY